MSYHMGFSHNKVYHTKSWCKKVLGLTGLMAFAFLMRADSKVRWWVSSEDGQHSLSPQPPLQFVAKPLTGVPSVHVDDSVTFQSILGIGSSLEHSTCYNLSLLPPERRERVLESLLHPERGIGMSLMRICIGTPDFTASPWYTYDDRPPGDTDLELKHFSIDKDREYVLPTLKLARKIEPRLTLFASPWSPPGWMKTNDRITGGRMRSDRFGPFAEYLARFVEAYRAEGLDIHAITIQNEPEYHPDTYPTCGWTAAQQRDFIRDHLGPLFLNRGLSTRIWCFDHNFNNPGFPTTILQDAAAARYVDGTAFHLYEGKPAAMSKLHEAFPNKDVYFTEGSTFGATGAVQIISIFRNWARSYNAWVAMIDHRGKPNPGPHACSPTGIVINSDTLELEYRFDYYMYGQFSKFIRPQAVRIASRDNSTEPAHVAFRNPDNSIVLVAANPKKAPERLAIQWRNQSFVASLTSKSVATFVWSP